MTGRIPSASGGMGSLPEALDHERTGMKARYFIGALALVAVCGPAAGQQRDTGREGPVVTVTGEALVNARPDKILVTLGIETWDAGIMIAKQRNAEILKKAMAAMRALGVPDKEIQTDHVSIEPRWKDDYRHESFIGFFVRNSLVVTLTDTSKIEPLLTDVLQAGVNYVHGIDFQTTEYRKLRDQARELALQAAREKAAAMAAALGRTIGAPIQIRETSSGSPWSYWSGWGYGRGQSMSQNVIQEAQAGPAEVGDTIAFGKIGIRASVGVTFELK
jgi:uncharacterized protein YggE